MDAEYAEGRIRNLNMVIFNIRNISRKFIRVSDGKKNEWVPRIMFRLFWGVCPLAVKLVKIVQHLTKSDWKTNYYQPDAFTTRVNPFSMNK